MANNHGISTFLETELGEAFDSIIDSTGYGSATFLVKEFMEKHKDSMIEFWNKQGKDGNSVFDKWFKKWNMTKAEQGTLKAEKEKIAHDKLVKQYLLLGLHQQKAEEHATAFPDKDPCEVIRIETYALQNADHHSKEKEPVVIPEEAMPLIDKLKSLGATERQIDCDGKMIYCSLFNDGIRLLALEMNGSYDATKKAFKIPIEPQQTEPQQQPHP